MAGYSLTQSASTSTARVTASTTVTGGLIRRTADNARQGRRYARGVAGGLHSTVELQARAAAWQNSPLPVLADTTPGQRSVIATQFTRLVVAAFGLTSTQVGPNTLVADYFGRIAVRATRPSIHGEVEFAGIAPETADWAFNVLFTTTHVFGFLYPTEMLTAGRRAVQQYAGAAASGGDRARTFADSFRVLSDGHVATRITQSPREWVYAWSLSPEDLTTIFTEYLV